MTRLAAVSLFSPQVGWLALDKRTSPARAAVLEKQQASSHAPCTAQPLTTPPSLPYRHRKSQYLDRYIAAYGAGGIAAAATFPKQYLGVKHTVQVGAPTDQKSSGRCWIFAGLNILRTKSVKTHGADFQYSQNYVAYWDKLERANQFLEKMIEFGPLAANSQRVLNHLEHFYTDGGDWELFRNIVVKYGVVPDYAMPETAFSGNSSGYMALLSQRLREVGGVLHQMAAANAPPEAMQAIKAAALSDVRALLTKYLGEPPTTFISKQADGKFSRVTPLEFYADSGVDLRSLVHLSHLPYLPLNTRVRVNDVNNVVGSPGMECLNVGLDDIKAAVRRSIIDGVPVLFAGETCENDFERSILAIGCNATESIAGLHAMPRLDKAQRLLYRVTKIAHAMSITGCDDIDNNKFEGDNPGFGVDAELMGPLWRIENSWKKRDTLYMTDAWFDAYVYAVVVDPRYLSEPVAALAADRFTPEQSVEPWDPLGRI